VQSVCVRYQIASKLKRLICICALLICYEVAGGELVCWRETCKVGVSFYSWLAMCDQRLLPKLKKYNDGPGHQLFDHHHPVTISV
jgi:hypothetical protein